MLVARRLRRSSAPAGAAAPAPEAALPAASTRLRSRTAPRPADAALRCRPRPTLDTLVPPEELAAELRLAADSAADEAVLEELRRTPTGPGEDGRRPTTRRRSPTPVTWDIDVATYNSHDRVQYYLDFFQGKGRERMGIWLTRMPRYEADDPRAAAASRACRATWCISR